ncbi:small nuclear ribonucleo protein G, partial [Endogone sp. FLAS-F59071]
MSKAATPELKKYGIFMTDAITVVALYGDHLYMDKRLFIQLNGARKVTGVLRGYDPFMNIVLDETVEE